jgi:hypothetical protein
MRKATLAAAHASFELRSQHARPRLKAPRRLLIEVFTNRPVQDRISDEWKLMKIEVRPQYTMKEVYHKVRSRWKDRWKIEWPKEDMEAWKSWGQEGLVDEDQIRSWADGERIIMMVQKRGEQVMEEMMQKKAIGINTWNEEGGRKRCGTNGSKAVQPGWSRGKNRKIGYQERKNGLKEKTLCGKQYAESMKRHGQEKRQRGRRIRSSGYECESADEIEGTQSSGINE